ncbi:hypothetical protein GQ53DRAFT_840042 [Thozetella sp. PMI_491]|nr:hypothetical protein GQ53DRAFT_840042 [Thozetella sp. PMI_491]
MPTTIPGHSILPITAADLPTHADNLRESKLNLSINRFLYKNWPNETAQSKQYSDAVKGALGNPDCESLKVIEDTTGEIVAQLFLTRMRPVEEKEPSSEDKASTSNSAPDYFVPEILAWVMEANAHINTPVKNREHLSVTEVYVRPSSRHQGIGSSLINLCLDRGKEAGLPVFAGTEPQARPFFLKLGFKDTGHFDIDLSKHAPENCGYGLFRLSGMIVEQ